MNHTMHQNAYSFIYTKRALIWLLSKPMHLVRTKKYLNVGWNMYH